MCAGWVKSLDRHGRVSVVPFQKPGVPESAGLTREACAQAAWAVDANGRRYRGAAAINAALAAALGLNAVLSLYFLPGVRQAEDAVYGWVAANRHRLPGTTPYCEQYPDECVGENCHVRLACYPLYR